MPQYCERWFHPRRSPIRPLTESTARRRHREGRPYTAVLPTFELPLHLVQIAPPWLTASFLDSLGREYLAYDFLRSANEGLFLKGAIWRQFAASGSDPVEVVRFAWQDDGVLLMERRDIQSGIVQDLRCRPDLSPNHEAFPEFGDYLYLCREERLPAGPSNPGVQWTRFARH